MYIYIYMYTYIHTYIHTYIYIYTYINDNNNNNISLYLSMHTLFTLPDLRVSSLRRGHANLLCIVPILTDDPRRESKETEKEQKSRAYIFGGF